MSVKLLGRNFAVNPAPGGLVAEVDTCLTNGRLVWSFSFTCQGQEFEGEWWEPGFTVTSDTFVARDWRHLVGQEGCFVGGGNIAQPQTYCVFEDETRHENHIRIIQRQGKVFTIELAGFAQMTQNEVHFTRVPFQALVDVGFDCIAVRVQDREQADKLIQQYLDLACLDEPWEWSLPSGGVFGYFYKPLDRD